MKHTIDPNRARRRAGALVVSVSLCLAGLACSSGDGAPGDLTGVLSAMNEGGIVCDSEITPYEKPESAADLGVEPARTFKCTVEGSEVQGTEYAAESDREQAIDMSTTLICSVDGSLFSYVANGAWMVTAEDPSSRTTDTALLDEIAEATSGEVSTIECSEEPGSIHGTNPDGPTTTHEHG